MALERFGIFAPVMGIKQDFPSILLPAAFTVNNENVMLRRGEIHRATMRAKELQSSTGGEEPVFTHVQTPDTYPILCYHWYEDKDGGGFLLAFTKAHIYHWNTGTSAWDEKFECSSNCDDWSVVTFNDDTLGPIVVATNNVDKVQWWKGTGNFAVVDDADNGIEVADDEVYLTKAKYVAVFENYLFLANVTVGGSAKRQALYWSKIGQYEEWNSSDAGSDAGSKVFPGGDQIMGLGNFQDFLLIFKERSFYRMWLVSTDDVFNSAVMSESLGTYAPHSIVNGIAGDLYFFASDYTIRQVRGALNDYSVISDPVDIFVKDIPPEYVHKIQATYVYEYGEMWFAIPCKTNVPMSEGEVTENNRVLVYLDGRWCSRKMPVVAFGEYERETAYTIDTIPFPSIDEIGWDTIDNIVADANFRTDLCSDNNGYSYAPHNSELDAGNDYTGYAVLSTDLAEKHALATFKRLSKIKVYARREGAGELTVELKRDHETAWQPVGSVSLAGSKDILVADLPCDYRARHFLLKISAMNHFRFIGVVFEYILVGTN